MPGILTNIMNYKECQAVPGTTEAFHERAIPAMITEPLWEGGANRCTRGPLERKQFKTTAVTETLPGVSQQLARGDWAPS